MSSRTKPRAVRDGRGGSTRAVSAWRPRCIDTARQVGAASDGRTSVCERDDGDAVVGLEFFREPGDREGSGPFSQAAGDCARVGNPMPRVDGDDTLLGRVWRRQVSDSAAERQGASAASVLHEDRMSSLQVANVTLGL